MNMIYSPSHCTFTLAVPVFASSSPFFKILTHIFSPPFRFTESILVSCDQKTESLVSAECRTDKCPLPRLEASLERRRPDWSFCLHRSVTAQTAFVPLNYPCNPTYSMNNTEARVGSCARHSFCSFPCAPRVQRLVEGRERMERREKGDAHWINCLANFLTGYSLSIKMVFLQPDHLYTITLKMVLFD